MEAARCHAGWLALPGTHMPSWVLTLVFTGPPDEVRAALAGHHALVAGLRERGRLRLAGALDGEDGALVVFEAGDLLEAGETARADPLVESGVAAWTLRELHEHPGDDGGG